MSIYDVLSYEIPIIGYSVLHQHRKSVNVKEYTNHLLDLRDKLKEESLLIKSSLENHISDLSAKSVQTTRGNLSHFLTTPIQTDADEIQRILKDQLLNASDQLLPKVTYGLFGGYESKFIIELKQVDMPKPRMIRGRSFLHNIGFDVGRNTSTIFESLFLVQGATNLDILEHMIRNSIGIYDFANVKKINEYNTMHCSLYNLLFLDGSLDLDMDRFELEVNFVKGKASYSIFNRELSESMKYFRKEIHSLNVSVWQRKLGLGVGEEYTMRIRTKDRFTLRSTITAMKRYIKDKNLITDSIDNGNWLIKEIV
jgi:hypothetical protein